MRKLFNLIHKWWHDYCFERRCRKHWKKMDKTAEAMAKKNMERVARGEKPILWDVF